VQDWVLFSLHCIRNLWNAGIETVRRDNSLLVKNLVTECFHKILIDRNIPGAVQFVKNTIADPLMNPMDFSLLVITKGLTKSGEDYANKSAHVELAERMCKVTFCPKCVEIRVV
jgi:DNA polymerase delta subunit 1